jgi:hypothetical protein
MICCGSVSGSELRKSFGSGSKSKQYLAVFQQQNFEQNLAFLMSEAALSPES